MSRASTYPFTPERHDLPPLADGRALALLPMTLEVARDLAPAISAIGPWAHYGATADKMQAILAEGFDGGVRYQVRVADVLAGCVLIRSPWLTGPYLQMLALLPAFHGSGTGSALLAWYEDTARAAKNRNVWLCVTGFNTGAQRLYARHGYTLAGTLPDLLREGDDELLMRKRLA